MLQFPRQLNPSILTAAGVCPNLARAQPPCLRADDDDGDASGTAIGLSLPNFESWITGFDTLLGGEPQRNGGVPGISAL